MEEMEYETLLRAVYITGRDFSNGADADIYRDMEYSQRVIEDPNWGVSKHDKEYDFRVKFTRVCNNVRNALSEGKKKIQCSDEHNKEITTMISTLSRRFYDKEELDKIIIRAVDIFANYGLKA